MGAAQIQGHHLWREFPGTVSEFETQPSLN
jgi:hypothetical protein